MSRTDQPLADTSDADLLAHWAAGSKSAGSALIDRHVPALHRFFRFRVAAAQAEDLVQQTFLACLLAHGRFRGEASFRTFLLGIARHQLLGHLRRTKRQSEPGSGLDSLRDGRTSPSGALVKRGLERSLFEALGTLSLQHQIVLQLVYWEGLSGADVAEVLGVSPSVAYTRLHRAKLKLRSALKERAPDLLDKDSSLARFDAWAQSLSELLEL